MKKRKIDLSVDFCGVHFKNPFMLSSSPVSNSGEMVARSFDAGWGGVAYKTICTGEVPIIHPSPRMAGYDYESKKLVGLQNVEQISDRSLEDNLQDIRYLKKHYPDHIVMASIMGFSNEEWGVLAKACSDAGADLLELNFSCPHMTVEGAGHKVGKVQELVERYTITAKQASSVPVIAKMTPNVTDITVPSLYAKRGGADGLAAINTVSAITGVDTDLFVPYPNVGGMGAASGYSGPAVKPIGLRCVGQMATHPDLGIPISGMGGIETWVDALEYILMGSTTLQVTTGIIHYGYRIIDDLKEGLLDYMEMKGINHLSELIGKALPNLQETDKFDLKRQGVASFDMDKCIGCGQCYIVCADSGGQALEWESKTRRPVHIEDKCLSCMVCKFVCPVTGMITYKEMPASWKRQETVTMIP
jgi:dihydropyrimidine dehydrogenase (NAD+) subunit PreA